MAELGDDSGFDRKHGFQGACRARYLVKLSEKNSRQRRKLRFSSLITCVKPSVLSLSSDA